MKEGDRLFSRVCCDRTRGNGFKVEEGRLRLDVRRKFSMIKVVRHWHRLSREVVDAPSLQTLQVRLDGALSTDGAVGVSAHCRELDLMICKGLFQLKQFCDSMSSSSDKCL